MFEHLYINNAETIDFAAIPQIADYGEFSSYIKESLGSVSRHCVNFFGVENTIAGKVILIVCIADDESHKIEVFSHLCDKNAVLAHCGVAALERYEREIHENFGITFEGHPWFKPVRTAADDYPFYHADSEEVHEVGVGPIHAGVIEPGHFRFICSGEKILHLEIMLGYQKRGVEKLLVAEAPLEKKALTAESIAGDSAIGYSNAFAMVNESLCGFSPSEEMLYARTIAGELERITIHTGDLSAICGDVAYQLGSAVFGRLRTPIINFMQKWCGNRLGKTMVRPFGLPYALTPSLRDDLLDTLAKFEKDFREMSHKIRRFPSVLSRLEKTGVVTAEQAREIGAVGMAAKSSALCRDIRLSHPYFKYDSLTHEPIVKHHGDVYSRTCVRIEEVYQSLEYVRSLVAEYPFGTHKAQPAQNMRPNSFCIALTEGWRGEICHCALTDADGKFVSYKVCDPSFHNWMALALAVRGNEISDFPICNKSFNLSYCGHDL